MWRKSGDTKQKVMRLMEQGSKAGKRNQIQSVFEIALEKTFRSKHKEERKDRKN